MQLRNFSVLVASLAISFAFFALAIDNGFWHGEDYIALEHSLYMQAGSSGLFEGSPPFKFQPLVYGIYSLLFNRFHFDPRGYFIFNILLHGINSFLVYLLVNTLLRDRAVALLSGLLFVFTVGSYGKSVMIVSGLEDLVITTLTLLTMIFYFKNEFSSGGRLCSAWFLLTLIFFVASMFTRSTSLAIIGAFTAFNLFFHKQAGHRIFRTDFIVLLAIALTALAIKTQVFHYTPTLYTQNPGPVRFVLYGAKNIINYLVRMIFPIHTTNLVAEAGAAVRFVYSFATEIRILLALTILSYSIFGFIFGNRTIRFFIAWTYIMVLPFAFFQFPKDWLNIRHLYLVSVGFVVVISAGAVYCSRLISHHRWRRFVPMVVPLFFIILARFIVTQLDGSYERKAFDPRTMSYQEDLVGKFPGLIIEDNALKFIE